MRVTNSMMVSRMMTNMNRNLKRMDKLYEDYNSGVKLHRPSDDPILVSRAMKLHTDLGENDQFKQNSGDAASFLDKTEGSLDELDSALSRIRDLTVQASNGTLTASDSKQVQEEVKQLKDQIIRISNDTYVGRHIFSGFQIDKPYLNDDGTGNVKLNKEIVTKDLSFPMTIAATNNTFEMDVPGLNDVDGSKFTGKYKVSINATSYANISAYAGALEESLNKSMGSEGIASITMPSTNVGDMKIAASEAVGITFDKPLDLSGVALFQQKVDKTFGQGKATVTQSGSTLTMTVNAGQEIDLSNSANFKIAPHDLRYADGTNNDKEINIRLMDANGTTNPDNKFFRVNVENNNLVIKTQRMENDQNFVLRSGSLDVSKQLGVNEASISSSNEKMDYKIGISASIDVNVTGDRVFGPVIDSDGDKIPDKTMMDTLNELIKNLEAGDTTKISAKLKEIDIIKDNTLKIKGEIGAKSNTVETVIDRIDTMKVNLSKLLSETEDTDMGEANMKINIYESIYKNSLAVGSKIIQPSLMDFLR